MFSHLSETPPRWPVPAGTFQQIQLGRGNRGKPGEEGITFGDTQGHHGLSSTFPFCDCSKPRSSGRNGKGDKQNMSCGIKTWQVCGEESTATVAQPESPEDGGDSVLVPQLGLLHIHEPAASRTRKIKSSHARGVFPALGGKWRRRSCKSAQSYSGGPDLLESTKLRGSWSILGI